LFTKTHFKQLHSSATWTMQCSAFMRIISSAHRHCTWR